MNKKMKLAEIVERTPEKGLTKSYRCACGAVRTFGVYVFAHWNDALRETCACGRVNHIRSGVVRTPEKSPKKKRLTNAELDRMSYGRNV